MDPIIIYQSEDGRTKIDVRLEEQTVWLNQKQLTELFGKAKGTISEHIKHIFEDKELEEGAVVRLFRTTAADGKSYEAARIRKAERRIAMTMGGWVTKLEGFLTLNDRKILQNAGTVSAELARAHAERAFVEFRQVEDRSLESDFDHAVKQLPPPTKDQP